MMPVRVRIAILVFLIGICSPEIPFAQVPDEENAPASQQLDDAANAWATCLQQRARAIAAGAERAELVADDALAACEQEERAFRTAAKVVAAWADVGKGLSVLESQLKADDIIEQAKVRYRQLLIAGVTSIRTSRN